MVGLPGTGKSSLARFVGKKLKGVVLDKDVIKSALLERGEEDWNRSGSLAYTILRDLVQEILGQGFDVVVDSPGHYLRFQQEMAMLAVNACTRFKVIECICEDEAKRRKKFERRKKGDAMPAQKTDFDQVFDEVEREDFRPQGLPALQVDTCLEKKKDLQKKVVTYLARKTRRLVAEDIEPSTIKVEDAQARAAAEGR
jgi:predicted kinase